MRAEGNKRIGLIKHLLSEPGCLIVTIFFPILLFFTLITRLLTELAGSAERNPFTMREQIMTMLQLPAATHGDIEPVEKEMIRRTFSFTETRVRDVRRPLIEVTAVDKQASCARPVR